MDKLPRLPLLALYHAVKHAPAVVIADNGVATCIVKLVVESMKANIVHMDIV